jgi:pyruvate/2-oxoglutarate dehydrogenase complex dihydrolipoamide acyltransferase (E2) component
MRYEFKLPELGKDAPDKAKLSFWYKEVGDGVTKEESLCEMFTDKATFDVPAPCDGTILEILVEDEDEEVAVGQIIAVMEVEALPEN